MKLNVKRSEEPLILLDETFICLCFYVNLSRMRCQVFLSFLSVLPVACSHILASAIRREPF